MVTPSTCVQINRPRGGTIFHQLGRLPSTHRSTSALRAHPVSRRTLNRRVCAVAAAVRRYSPAPPAISRSTREPRPRTPPRLPREGGLRSPARARSLTRGVNGFHAPVVAGAPRAVRIAPRRRARGSSRAVVPRIPAARYGFRRATRDARAVRITPRRPTETRNPPRVSTQEDIFRPEAAQQIRARKTTNRSPTAPNRSSPVDEAATGIDVMNKTVDAPTSSSSSSTSRSWTVFSSSTSSPSWRPAHPTLGTDYEGNLCTEDLPVRYWVNPLEIYELTQATHTYDMKDVKSICLKNCPSTGGVWT